jgi:rod shape determining protein RodA
MASHSAFSLPLSAFHLTGRHWRHFDWTLLALLLGTTAFGMATVWGATQHSIELRAAFFRQTVWWAVGALALSVALAADYEVWRRLAWVCYAAALVLLAYVLTQPSIKGARSWIRFPIGLGFQPAEVAKLAVVFVLARELAYERLETMSPRQQMGVLLKLGMIVGPIAGLILLQPDLGTTVVFFPTIAAMAYVAGLSRRLLAALAVAGLLTGVAAYPFLKPYQQARLWIHLNPEVDPRGRGYNIIQAKIALGSGGLSGKGMGKGTQSYFGFLPEHQTDFIFNSLGEQFGFAGCATLLGLYVGLLWRCLAAASRARNRFGSLLAAGLTAIFASHVFLNIFIATQILPVTGLPLPLMSLGGSFLVSNYVIFGLVLNIGMRRHNF